MAGLLDIRIRGTITASFVWVKNISSIVTLPKLVPKALLSAWPKVVTGAAPGTTPNPYASTSAPILNNSDKDSSVSLVATGPPARFAEVDGIKPFWTTPAVVKL